jgi:hypothetical protein
MIFEIKLKHVLIVNWYRKKEEACVEKTNCGNRPKNKKM